MIKLADAKKIINYVAEHNLSEKYRVFPFDGEAADAELYGQLVSEYNSCDRLLEQLGKDHREICAAMRLKDDKLPALLKMTGYFIDAERLENSYFYGRESELFKMKVAVNKKIKNNILLIGNPGTGKTKLVEAFALENRLHNVFVVECAKLIGTTEYRGAFEQRTTDLIEYAKKCGLIIFFDEIHALINLGKSTGGMSITDILKPYLLDSELVFIGATTTKEAHFFAEDEAFKRRFSMIKVEEPSDAELIGIKKSLEENLFAEAVLPDSDTQNVLKRLREELPSMFFPDKLIDFMDYLYSYKSVGDSGACSEAVLDEFIKDQTL